MENILEKQEKVLQLKARMNEIITLGETETRELTEEETNELADIRSQIDTLETEIKTIEEENRKIEKENKIIEKKEIRTMSLIKMINTVLEGRNFSEDEMKAMAEARADFAKSGISPKGQIVLRTIQATEATKGEETVIEDKWNLEVAVRNNLIATRMGADYVGGLIGNVRDLSIAF